MARRRNGKKLKGLLKGGGGISKRIFPVVKTLSELYSYYATDYFFDIMIFANGGDRRKNNSPEEAYCTWRNIKTVYNVGGNKTQSSSELISNWNNQNAEKEN